MCEGVHFSSPCLKHITIYVCLCVCKRVCVNFIRSEFDLRQLLAALHGHCKRQQWGEQMEGKKDGKLEVEKME